MTKRKPGAKVKAWKFNMKTGNYVLDKPRKRKAKVKAVKAYALAPSATEIDGRTTFSTLRWRLQQILTRRRDNGWSNGDRIIPVLVTPITKRRAKK